MILMMLIKKIQWFHHSLQVHYWKEALEARTCKNWVNVKYICVFKKVFKLKAESSKTLNARWTLVFVARFGQKCQRQLRLGEEMIADGRWSGPFLDFSLLHAPVNEQNISYCCLIFSFGCGWVKIEATKSISHNCVVILEMGFCFIKDLTSFKHVRSFLTSFTV